LRTGEITMTLTEEEENRIGRLEGQVDLLEKKLDDLINGMIDTIKNHPIWNKDKISNIKSEEKEKKNDREFSLQLFSPEGIDKFLKLCDNLKTVALQILESAIQTDNVKYLKNRLDNATVWNEIFELSISAIKECTKQFEEKGNM
jgi:hypothetical protein